MKTTLRANFKRDLPQTSTVKIRPVLKWVYSETNFTIAFICFTWWLAKRNLSLYFQPIRGTVKIILVTCHAIFSPQLRTFVQVRRQDCVTGCRRLRMLWLGIVNVRVATVILIHSTEQYNVITNGTLRCPCEVVMVTHTRTTKSKKQIKRMVVLPFSTKRDSTNKSSQNLDETFS